MSSATPAQTPTPILGFDGTFTIRTPRGTHQTVRIRTDRKGKMQGSRLIEIMNGPNNEDDFAPFGFVSVDEAARRSGYPPAIVVWKGSSSVVGMDGQKRPRAVRVAKWHAGYKAQGWTDREIVAAMLCDLALGPESLLRSLGYEVDESRVCRRCGRKLTTPESIDFGIGPDCATREAGP